MNGKQFECSVIENKGKIIGLCQMTSLVVDLWSCKLTQYSMTESYVFALVVKYLLFKLDLRVSIWKLAMWSQKLQVKSNRNCVYTYHFKHLNRNKNTIYVYGLPSNFLRWLLLLSRKALSLYGVSRPNVKAKIAYCILFDDRDVQIIVLRTGRQIITLWFTC